MADALNIDVMMRDKVIVRPNDRLTRGVLLCAAIAWWIAQAVAFIHDRSGLGVIVLLGVALFAPMVWLLTWVTTGRWVITLFNDDLIVDRQIAGISFWRTAHPIASISDFHVKERRMKIKGNASPRFQVLMDGLNGPQEIAWYRQRADAEALAVRLQVLTRKQ